MNNQEFVSLIKQKVRDAAVSGTLSNLTQPKGRRPNKSLLEMSEWFNSLSPEDKETCSKVMYDVADNAVFGFLAVLDGERSIEDSLAIFELFYVNETKRIILNGSDQEQLHDIFNAT